MNFYSKYLSLCNAIQKSPSRVAQECNISKPSVNRWKKGTTPTDATLLKLADYFGVSVAELKGEEEPDAPVKEELPIVTRIARGGERLSPEDQERALEILRLTFPGKFDD